MENTEKERKSSISSSFLNRLKNGTILGSWTPRPRIPVSVINFMRALAERNDPDFNQAADGSISSYYKAAKDRMNRLWAGRGGMDINLDGPHTPTSRFKTLRGVLASYWTSEKWAQAWAYTGAIGSMSLLNAQNTVWLAEAGARFINSIATDPMSTMTMGNIGPLGATVATNIALSWAIMRSSLEMQRNMAEWMSGQFNQSVFSNPEIIQRITHNQKEYKEDEKEENKDPDAMPDNPSTRMSPSVRQTTRNLINLGEGALSTVATSAFIALSLHEKSVPVAALDNLGHALNNNLPGGLIDLVPGKNGTLLLASLVAGTYISATLWKARALNKAMSENDKIAGKVEGDLFNTLKDAFDNGDAIAASKSHKSQRNAVEKAYKHVDETWKTDNKLFTKYINFMNFQQAVGAHLIAPIPGLAGRASGNLSFEGFLQSYGLVTAFINRLYYVFNAIPQYAYMTAAADRVKEMAIMIDKVQNKKAFYELSGVHDFEHAFSDTDSVRIRNLYLLHRNQYNNPFLKIDELTIKPQDWIYIQGVSGAGKTSLLKAIAGLWPYGGGHIETPEHAKMFYARQEAHITGKRTLAEHILYGAADDDMIPSNLEHEMDSFLTGPKSQGHRIVWALENAGLDDFADKINDDTHSGKPWQEVLSGGQKQRLVLARILYQNPDIILLDEAASALDPAARTEFFETIKARCPKASVLAIVHDDKMPQQKDGKPFFNKILKIKDGSATLCPNEQMPPANTGAYHHPAQSFGLN